MFASMVFQENLVGIDMDEVHVTYKWLVLAQRCVTHYIALIGCRSTQMHREEFWSVPIDNASRIQK